MEEAETLADRIMILKQGEIVTIGNSVYLKSKFDSKFTVEISYPSVESYEGLLKILSEVIPKNDLAGVSTNATNLTFRTEFKHLKCLFKLMQDNKELKKLVTNWEFHETSLSEIFLSLVKEEGSVSPL